MGSALHRLEILLIGLVVLIAGAVAAVLLVLRPPSQPAAQLGTPRPLATSAPVSEPTGIPALPPTAPPIQNPTAAPASTALATAPALTAPISPLPGAMPTSGEALAGLMLPPIARGSWLWPLLAVGVGGIALVLMRRRRRRMTYTNQSVGQLLAAADTSTRTDNLKIMRDLAKQGLLTTELAAAAGIDLPTSPKKRMPKLPRMRLVLPRIALPRLTIPPLHLRAVHFPQLRLPRRTARVVTALSHGSTSVEAAPTHRPVDSVSTVMPHPGPDVASLPDVLSMPAVEPSETEASNQVPAADAAVPWIAEDRVLAVAHALAEVWAEQTISRGTAIQSAIVALDTSSAPGRAGAVREPPVLVMINGHPEEDTLIHELPERITVRHPTWQSTWRKDRLEVIIGVDAQPPTSGPPIIPVLTHGRGGTTIRFFPLASWRHLGFYGAGALDALHAALASLLFAQPPSDLALAILDNGEVTPLYRDVAHLVSLPGDTHETIDLLAQALRHGAVNSVHDGAHTLRPLVLVVVEPDSALLTRLSGLVARLQARPTTPLHLMIVQERLNPAGRELYALLPGLITSGGQGSAALLPGQGAWPKTGEARLAGRGMRLEGRALGMDEAAIAAHLRSLHGRPAGLPAVLWDIAATSVAAPGGATLHAQTDTPELLDAAGELHETLPAVERREPIDELHAVSVDIALDSAKRETLLIEDARTTPLGTRVDAPAPLTLDGAQEGEQTPPHSRRAALLLATIDAGTAVAAPQPLAAPRQNELEAQPPQASTAPVVTAVAPLIEPDNGWAVGPAPLGRVAMADLMTRLVAMPAIVAGQANELGVTKNRLADLLKGTQKAQARELAESLMAWFDLAGLLVEPTRPGRLRHPRALITTDLAEIAAQLNALPCPDKATVQRMWAESNEGNN